MKTINKFAVLLGIVLVLGGNAQAQTTPGCYTKTLSATGRTLLYSSTANVLFSGSYYTTGTPTGVTLAIETGNVLAATSTPIGKISSLTDTTSAAFVEVPGAERYWYANLSSLAGGTSPTVVLSYCLRVVDSVTMQPTVGVAASTLTFEGTTADDFETTFSVTDATADNTITFPDASGTVALAGAAQGAANGVAFVNNGIEAEGATADAFETTISFTDPTADRTVTVPDGGGTVMVSSLSTNATDAANSVTGASAALVFEGATADTFETSVTATDPTADRTVTLADGGGTVMLSSLATNATDAANAVTGASNALVLEGATADAFETSITPTDPTADRTITTPDASGTVMLSALATNGVDLANAVTGGSNTLIFEGGTADTNETSITATDPTADRTVTLADGSGTVMLSSLATNAPDAANSVYGTSANLAFEGSTADGFETFITATDPAIDTTVTIPAIASGAHTLGVIEVSFKDQVTGDATDRTFYVATRGVIVNACSQVHSVAAGGVSTIQVVKDTGTAAPGAGTDLLTAAFDLNGTANTVVAKTSGDFVSLAARTLATGDRLSVDYANAIQSTAGNLITCQLLPN